MASKILAVTGLAVAGFTAMHFGALAAAPVSLSWVRALMEAGRVVYQHPVVEGALAAAIVVHMATASYKMLSRSRTKPKAQEDAKLKADGAVKKGPTMLDIAKLHRYAGYVILPFVAAHAFALRIFPIFHMKDPSLIDVTYVSFIFDIKENIVEGVIGRVASFMTLTAALFHGIYGVYRGLQILGAKKVIPLPQISPATWILINQAGAVFALLVVAGVAGTFETVNMPLRQLWRDNHAAMFNIPFDILASMNLLTN